MSELVDVVSSCRVDRDRPRRFIVTIWVHVLLVPLVTSCTSQESDEQLDGPSRVDTPTLAIAEHAAPVAKETPDGKLETLCCTDYEWPTGPVAVVAAYDSARENVPAGRVIFEGLMSKGIVPIAAGSRGVSVMVSASRAVEARAIIKTLIETHQLNAIVVGKAATPEE